MTGALRAHDLPGSDRGSMLFLRRLWTHSRPLGSPMSPPLQGCPLVEVLVGARR